MERERADGIWQKVLALSSFLPIPSADGIVFCTHAETLASADLEGILEMK